MAKVRIEIPHALKRAAAEFAETDGVSLSQFIALALAEKVSTVGAAEFFAERGRGWTGSGRWRFWTGGWSEICSMI